MCNTENKLPYISATRSFLLKFSHVKMPEGVTEAFRDNEPDVECSRLAFNLLNGKPMFSFVFSTDNQMPPSLQKIREVMQRGYSERSDDPETHESYGLILDTLRLMALTPPTAKVTIDNDCSDITDFIEKLVALQAGSIIQIGDNLCTIQLSPITNFLV